MISCFKCPKGAGERREAASILEERPGSKYFLRLVNEVPCPVIKGKKFELEVELVDGGQQRVVNPNRLSFDLHLYSSDPKPVLIDSTPE
jgi:hypothetical protein